jgi:hypothetical protein
VVKPADCGNRLVALDVRQQDVRLALFVVANNLVQLFDDQDVDVVDAWGLIHGRENQK